MAEVKDRENVYERLRKAHEKSRGIRLSAEELDKLMDDTAIRDAVYQTYSDEVV